MALNKASNSMIEGAPVNVKDFGAVGDGVTDDTAAIQAALNSSFESVLFPDGTYYVPSWATVSLSNAKRLFGAGIIKGDDTEVFIKPLTSLEIDGLTIRNFTFGLQNVDADNGDIGYLTIQNCSFTDNGGHINLESPIDTAMISKNRFANSTASHAIRIGTNTYADQDTWKKISIVDNRCDNATQTTGDVSFCLIYGLQSIIERNIIDTIDNTGTGSAWGVYTKSRFSSVSHNNIYNVTAASNTDNGGINIKGQIRGETSDPQGFAVRCIGNNVRTIGASNARGYCIRAQTGDVLIEGNQAEDGGKNGIILDRAAGSDNCVIVNNVIRFATATGTVGVRFETGGSRHIVSNNRIINAEKGIRLSSGASADTDGVAILNNMIDATTSGIALNVPSGRDMTNISISKNMVFGSPTNGIVNEGGAGTLSRFEILDNTIQPATNFYNGFLPSEVQMRQKVYIQTTDGSASPLLKTKVLDDSAIRVEVDCLGVKSDGSDRALFNKGALYYRDGGNVTLQGSTYNLFSAIESDATWGGLDFFAGTSELNPRVTGKASTTINWSAEVIIRTVN